MSRARNQGSKWIRKNKRLAIYLRDDCACVYCGRGVAMGATLSLDHIIACELGGTNEAANLVTSCISCNSSKSDLTVRAWYKTLRANGRNASAIGARIRRLIKRDLVTYRKHANLIIASIGDEAPATTGHLTIIAG